MHRFFVDPSAVRDNAAVITGSEARHLAGVLRLAAGDTVHLFDGTGTVYRAVLTRVKTARVEADILDAEKDAPDAGPSLHLGMALLKGNKMDAVVRQASELGVAGLRPFRSGYCNASEKDGRRADRWRRIAREACKQCNRPVPLDCAPVSDFASLVQEDFGRRLLFWEEETSGDDLPEVLRNIPTPDSVLLIIGPEGGFSSEEEQLARRAGCSIVSLGRRILRAETAALAAVAVVQYLLGNLRRR